MGCTGWKDGNPIWPGNTVVVQTCVDGLVPSVADRVRAARGKYVKRPGCAVFAVPAQKLL